MKPLVGDDGQGQGLTNKSINNKWNKFIMQQFFSQVNSTFYVHTFLTPRSCTPIAVR